MARIFPSMAALLLAASAVPVALAAGRGEPTGGSTAAVRTAAPKVPHRQVGKASFYAQKFAGRKMANGKRMDPNDNNAASKTLPLGTKAVVTNLQNGRSAVVTIEDRGPYVDGRIVDLSPASARQIGLDPKQGVTTVEVKPIAVPAPDGGTIQVADTAP